MTLENLPKKVVEGFVIIKHITDRKVGALHVTENRDLNPVISAEVILTNAATSEVKEGDEVLVNSNAGISIKVGGQEYFIIREKGNIFSIL